MGPHAQPTEKQGKRIGGTSIRLGPLNKWSSAAARSTLCKHPAPDRLNVRRDWLKEAVAARLRPAEGPPHPGTLKKPQ